MQYDNFFRITCHIIHRMGNEQNRHRILLSESRNFPEKFIPSCRIQSRCRLIQYKKLRLHRKNPCDRHLSLLPSGKFKGRLAIRFFSDSKASQRLFREFLRLLFAFSLVQGSENNVFQNRFLKKLVFRILKNKPDLKAKRTKIKAFLGEGQSSLFLHFLYLSLPEKKPLLLNEKRGILPKGNPYLSPARLHEPV